VTGFFALSRAETISSDLWGEKRQSLVKDMIRYLHWVFFSVFSRSLSCSDTGSKAKPN